MCNIWFWQMTSAHFTFFCSLPGKGFRNKFWFQFFLFGVFNPLICNGRAKRCDGDLFHKISQITNKLEVFNRLDSMLRLIKQMSVFFMSNWSTTTVSALFTISILYSVVRKNLLKITSREA